MLFNRDRALDTMDRLGLDALIAAVPRNVYYTSGIWSRVSEFGFQEPESAVIFPRDPDKAATLVIPEFAIADLLEVPTCIPRVRVTEHMNTSAILREPESVRLDPLQADLERLYSQRVDGGVEPDIVAGTKAALAGMGLSRGRIGFDDWRLAQHVARVLPGLHVEDAHDAWMHIRKVKTENEIQLLRHGARLNEQALREIIPMIEPGVVWRQVAGRFRNFLQDHGAVVISAQKALQFGARYQGHFFPDVVFADNDWKVYEGQTIIFECWGTWSNYAFDMSRTLHVGAPSDEYRRTCETITAAHCKAESLLHEGMTTHEAWKAVSQIAYAMDVPTPKKTLVLFHSIGLDIIELPSSYPAFGRLKDFKLEEGTVFNFEYLYFGHSPAPFHLESTYVMRKSGAERLHTMSHDLIVTG